MWSLADDECYVSIDIEADGPAPGLNSMLSLGAAAFIGDGTLADTFSANLEALPEAREDPKTMRWWAKQPETWAACRTQIQDPGQAMRSFNTWVQAHAKTVGTPVMVAYPRERLTPSVNQVHDSSHDGDGSSDSPSGVRTS